MVVLTLSKCPSRLKGDVTKWLFEISNGVYVGKLSARVRDLLWERVCEYCGSGKATMVFSARNEQGFSFYVHNTSWKPEDFDGIVLIKKPLLHKTEKSEEIVVNKNQDNKKTLNQSNIRKSISLQAEHIDISDLIVNKEIMYPMDFVAIDLETTGLKSDEDNIIEMAAVRYKNGQPEEQYHTLVKCEKNIPDIIIRLTGIKNEILESKGQSIEEAINGLIDFIGNDILVGHYISFDMLFLRMACKRLNIVFKEYKVIDTVILAKRTCNITFENYRLVTLVKKLGISKSQKHRALPDAILAAKLYLKLNEMS